MGIDLFSGVKCAHKSGIDKLPYTVYNTKAVSTARFLA